MANTKIEKVPIMQVYTAFEGKKHSNVSFCRLAGIYFIKKEEEHLRWKWPIFLTAKERSLTLTLDATRSSQGSASSNSNSAKRSHAILSFKIKLLLILK